MAARCRIPSEGNRMGSGGGGGGMLSDCLKGKGFSLGVMKMFRN